MSVISNNVWYTSDTHFGHCNIIAYCKRPWLQSGDYDYNTNQWVSKKVKYERIKEHDEEIISRWNSVVKSCDIVYHCGDFAWVNNIGEINKIIEN